MAFGCCACATEIFRTADDQIDEARLAPLLDKLREERVDEDAVEAVRKCNCCCHVDGQSFNVMC